VSVSELMRLDQQITNETASVLALTCGQKEPQHADLHPEQGFTFVHAGFQAHTVVSQLDVEK
jgi:hypothetical protein